MNNLKILKQSAKSLFNRVTGQDSNIPPKQKEAEESVKRIDKELSALYKEWKAYYETGMAHMDAAERLRNLSSSFIQSHPVAEPQKLNFFVEAQSRMIHMHRTFPILATLENVLGTRLKRVKELRLACQEAFDKRESHRDKVAAVSKKTFEQNKLSQTQADFQHVSMAYDNALADFTAGVSDLQNEQSVQLLLRMCSFLVQQRLMYEGANNFFGPSRQMVDSLSEQIRGKQLDSDKERKANIADSQRAKQRLEADTILDSKLFALMKPYLVAPHEPKRFSGEGLLLRVEHVLNIQGERLIAGTLLITSYRLIFMPYGRSSASQPSAMHVQGDHEEVACASTGCRSLRTASHGVFCSLHGQQQLESHVVQHVPITYISRLETGSSRDRDRDRDRRDDKDMIMLWCKDLQYLTLSFKHSPIDATKVLESLSPLVWSIDNLFAYYHRPVGLADDGWSLYDENGQNAEWARMGIPNEFWKISSMNQEYKLVPTYPGRVVLPSSTPKEVIYGAAEFRSKGRFPVLCWKNPQGKACIFRCSQPLVGVKRARSECDEGLVRTFGQITTSGANVPAPASGSLLPPTALPQIGTVTQLLPAGPTQTGKSVYIFDCRPTVNAIGNIAKGGGWESVDNYTNCHLEFLHIENIHLVREAFTKLRGLFFMLPAGPEPASQLVLPTSRSLPFLPANSPIVQRYSSILAALRTAQSCKWLKLISTILTGAHRVASVLGAPCSVMIHCSDGWDRTPSITGLAQLMLDPYTRTLKGFAILVEREWISFGHKFAQRFGHGVERRKYEDSQRAPIFVQWLDSVYQLLIQFPQAFEFTELFLTELIEHVYSCRFGTFLFNTERERTHNNVAARTQSVWSYMLHHSARYINSGYRPSPGVNLAAEMLHPVTACESLHLYLSFFQRWDPHVSLPPSLAFTEPDPALDQTPAYNDDNDGHQPMASDSSSPRSMPEYLSSSAPISFGLVGGSSSSSTAVSPQQDPFRPAHPPRRPPPSLPVTPTAPSSTPPSTAHHFFSPSAPASPAPPDVTMTSPRGARSTGNISTHLDTASSSTDLLRHPPRPSDEVQMTPVPIPRVASPLGGPRMPPPAIPPPPPPTGTLSIAGSFPSQFPPQGPRHLS